MTKLARTLSFRDLLFIVIGSVIGSGIFLSPGGVLDQVNATIVPAMLVWLVGGLLSLLGALTYGELSATNPAAGGLYIYIRDSFGRLPAFLFGWTFFFVITSGTVAALAVAFTTYLKELVPLTDTMSKVVAVLIIAVMMIVNVRGTRQSARLNNLTTVIKVIALLVMSAVLLWMGRNFNVTGDTLMPASIDGKLASGFGLAMIGVLWAYEGWQYATFSAGEAIEPQRNFPRAFLLGTLALIAIYLLANFAYLAALGANVAAKSDSIAATAVGTVIGGKAAKLVSVAILISIFSAANSTFLTAPRVYYAMAYDGLFFQKLAEVHPRYGTPAIAIMASSVWSAVLAMSGTFDVLISYVVSIGWAFYGLAAASIFVYRKKYPDASTRSYSVPFYPLTPILFILAAAALVINTTWAQPLNSAKGIGIVLLGVPAYFIWRSRLKKVGEKLDALQEKG
jgi:basic amino acid/polyamine antiporter, APA family